jgi:transposase InsO family protein
MAKKEYDVPGKGLVKYKWETFKKWWFLYQKYGFEGLKPSGRADKGVSRKISGELKKQIVKLAEEHDLKTISNLYRHLLKTKVITTESFTEATLRNFIRNADLQFKGIEKKERRAFEMPHINMLWTADFMHGPYITAGKKRVKTYLCVIIEDHSRALVGAIFFLAEGSLSLQITLKEAILTYGKPNKLYCDNGKVFVSGYLHLVCARLGIALIHSKPYDSPSRGNAESMKM